MHVRSLGFRLAAWYFVTVVAITALTGTGYWFGVRSALEHARDEGLRYRLLGLRAFLSGVEPATRAEIATALADISQLGELYQVFDADGVLIAQSNGLTRHAVHGAPPPSVDFDAIHYSDGGPADFPLRLAMQKARVGGDVLILGVADPRPKFAGVQRAFAKVLWASVPVVLLLATAGGVWLGRRALAPVARITEEARAIEAGSLSTRLVVPRSRDELQQLTETLNAMLARIEAAFTRTRQFTADASHELRTPMTLIHTAAEFALRRERSHADLVDGMGKILRESQRTTALIDDLLALARGDAAEPVALSAIDVVPLLRDVAEQASAMAAATSIDVQVRLEAETLRVRADAGQLRRLLLILIDNALKYTPPGGCVTLAARAVDGDATIAVSDTGAGIAPDDLPHVFERFWRADKVRSRDAGGSGLGLAIARQIADRHGASLTVDSEVGRGSTFTLRLPSVGSWESGAGS